MDFAALPPEINSARMYAGPGATPMTAAASAWSGLGAELTTTASSYESVIATMTDEEWRGPASAAMVAAVTPYLQWMTTTAAALEHAAGQAMASAAAYQAAFAMTVPPAVIAANRAQLMALVATNFLGQNTPAIAANEALYGQMWAQDAAAMYGYAGSSAIAGRLDPLTSPTSMTNPTGLAGQAAAVAQAGASSAGAQTGLSQLVATLSDSVQGLSSPLTASGSLSGSVDSLNSFLGIPFVQNAINGSVNTAAWVGMNAVPTLVSLAHSITGSAPGTLIQAVGSSAPALAGAVGAAAPVTSVGVGGGPVVAAVGQAAPVGGLSVPGTWSAATPASAGAATLAGSGWTAAAEGGVSVVPAGLPSSASAGRSSFGFGTPRYGVKPTVMPRPVMVG